MNLQRAIAEEIAAWDDDIDHPENYADIANRLVIVVMDNPTVRRWKDVTYLVDNEPEYVWEGSLVTSTTSARNYGIADGHNELLARLRTGGPS